MKCKLCGKEFEPQTKIQKYCSGKCANSYWNKFKRFEALEKIQRREERDRCLNKWINEAAQCGLSYGKYRMMIEHFGKTFEELRL